MYLLPSSQICHLKLYMYKIRFFIPHFSYGMQLTMKGSQLVFKHLEVTLQGRTVRMLNEIEWPSGSSIEKHIGIWSNYSDLKHDQNPQMVVKSKGNPLISGKPRLVKYYILARIVDFFGEPSWDSLGNSVFFFTDLRVEISLLLSWMEWPVLAKNRLHIKTSSLIPTNNLFQPDTLPYKMWYYMLIDVYIYIHIYT